jgi:hypothetical protein
MGTPVTGGFTIRNVASAGGDGKKKVSWEAFLSFDAGFSADDLLLGSGEIAPLVAGDFVAIGPADLDLAAWPGYGLCRFLLRISADDDAAAANNAYVSPPMELYIEDSEGADYAMPYNDGQGTISSTRPIPVTQDIGALKPGQTMVIRGWADDGNTGRYDTYRFTLNSGIGTVRAYAAWSTGTDMGGLYIWWDRNNLDTYSTTTAINREPGSGYLSTSGWTSTDVGYVSLRSYLYVPAGTYYPYTIYLQGTD